ncbi:hypothetical protein [Phaeobacter italicus]|uniref:hypothetical protein n=1 Tax=Phaeobacter italicus TaxID=481446 RepID=UPI00242FC5FB|nr:hypothetical protein [Phaeobacter italicus]MCI5100738.1 hypothetical protein [Phaeobacter italicus]
MRKALKTVLGLVLTLLIIGFIAFKATEVRHLKGFLPPAYGHVDLEDKTTLTAGFGPGGYDAVLAFFRLSEDISSLVLLEGEAWLQDAEKSVELRRSVQVGEWISTPLAGEVYPWASASNCAPDLSDWWVASHTGHSCPGIAAYLRGYGFLDQLDVSKTVLVDEVLQGEGAFISRRRVGYLIVAPERNLVIFAHAG